jgi:predicted enzyme related to lactoylglutathione lyase
MHRILSWFEIPVTSMERAVAFYSRLLDEPLQWEPGSTYVFLPTTAEGPGGALYQSPEVRPTPDGVVIYLSAGDDLSPILARAESAGGTVLVRKTLISEENGYYAWMLDSEGNRIGLHSRH